MIKNIRKSALMSTKWRWVLLLWYSWNSETQSIPIVCKTILLFDFEKTLLMITDLLNTLVHRFHQFTSWCPCPYFQFSRCAIPSICEFSMLVSFLPRELNFWSCYFNQMFMLCFISHRRPWNSAATDNGLWHMLYSNLFDCHNMAPGEEQDNKLVHENEDGHAGTNPVINVNWLKAFRRRCKGKTPYIWYNFFFFV